MVIAGKRVPRGSLLLVLGMLAVSVCTLMMSAALRANRLSELQSREFYSDSARDFSITGCEDAAFWEDFFAGGTDDVILYHQIPDLEMDIRAVYAKGNVNVPEMVWGRFFDETDQFAGLPSAVVGRDWESALVEEDGTFFLDYGGTRFQVLGIMGYAWESRVDRMVYLDFASGLEIVTSDGEYVLDGGGEQEIEQCLDALELELAGKGRIDIAVKDMGEAQGFLRQNFGAALYFLIYLSFFLSVVIITSLWLGYRRRQIGIMQMLGGTRAEVFLGICRSFLSVTVLSWMAGLVAGFGLSGISEVIVLRYEDMAVSLAATVAAGLLALALPLHRCIGQELNTKMR